MFDSIETSEREAMPLIQMPLPASIPMAQARSDAAEPAQEPINAAAFNEMRQAVGMALALLKDASATAADRNLVVGELNRCLQVQPVARANPWKEAVLDALADVPMDAPIGTPPAEILRRVIEARIEQAMDPAITSFMRVGHGFLALPPEDVAS